MRSSHYAPFHPVRFSLLIGLAAALTGCLDGDSQLNEQLRALRAELDAAQRAKAALETQLAAAPQTPPPAPAASEDARVRTLEEELATVKRQLDEARSRSQEASPGKGLSSQGLKDLAAQLQRDLMEKVTALSDQIQSRLPNTDLEDVTVKRIKPPAEIESAFSSAITFTLKDASGRQIPVRFPVTAGLDGSWKVPTVDDVRAAMSGVLASGTAIASTTPAVPANPAEALAPPPSPQQTNGSFVQQPDGSILVNWDAGTTPTTSSSPPGTPAAPAPTQQPSPATPPPKPADPKVPAPVMPVQRDIIIRFD